MMNVAGVQVEKKSLDLVTPEAPLTYASLPSMKHVPPTDVAPTETGTVTHVVPPLMVYAPTPESDEQNPCVVLNQHMVRHLDVDVSGEKIKDVAPDVAKIPLISSEAKNRTPLNETTTKVNGVGVAEYDDRPSELVATYPAAALFAPTTTNNPRCSTRITPCVF